MSRVMGMDGHKYVPTLVPLQVHRQSMVTEQNNVNYYVSTPPPTPPRMEQSPEKPPEKTQEGLKKIPAKAEWSRKNKILVGSIIAAAVVAIIVAAILMGVLLSQKSATTTTTTTTAAAVTTSGTVTSAYWSFDNITTDLYGVYNGQLVNGATYTLTSSSQPYLGVGRALSLTSSSNQSFLVSTPFLNLAYTSFTIEAWIYSTTGYTTDYPIFSQCQCSTCANQCLYFLVRGNHLYIGFNLNDLAGVSTLGTSTWYHVAFVYNYQTQQQILYLNGVQDSIQSNAAPYQGTNGTILIGSALIYLTNSYFNGYIDNLKVVTRAKSATEILNDGSLIAYYSFDLPSPSNDNGPNGLNGTSVNTGTVSGRVNQAIRFTGSSSYFQAYGFYQTVYGVYSNKPFSISLWINPAVTTSSTFLQMSQNPSAGWLLNLMGIWSTGGSTGQIVIQGYINGGNWPTIFGPYATANAWTHISWTFSSTYGYSLYVNGVLYGSTGVSSYTNGNAIEWLQLGYNYGTNNNYLYTTPYQGSMDEVYVHNRALAASEVYALANP